MTRKQMEKALEMAKSGNYSPCDLSIFNGFGRPGFRPVHVTMDALATLISWQCLCLDGSVDTFSLDEIGEHRRKFIVLDPLS